MVALEKVIICIKFARFCFAMHCHILHGNGSGRYSFLAGIQTDDGADVTRTTNQRKSRL